MAYKGKCAHGKLKSPVTNRDGSKRYCKLAKKPKRAEARTERKSQARDMRLLIVVRNEREKDKSF